jgi:hypothetical protein
MLIGLLIVDGCFSELGYECIITSAVDGKHMADSKHYEGLALDFRTKHVDSWKLDELLTLVSVRLGDQDFDWLMEARDGPNQHLHVEFDVH